MAGKVLGDLLPCLEDADVRVAHAAVFAVTRFVQLLRVACPPGWPDRPLTGNHRAQYTRPSFAGVGLPENRMPAGP